MNTIYIESIVSDCIQCMCVKPFFQYYQLCFFVNPHSLTKLNVGLCGVQENHQLA